MAEVFVQLSLLIFLAIGLALILRILKQPLIIAYIFTGILAGPLVFNLISDREIIEIFSQFGIAFLLFIVGMHLSPKIIKEVGPVSLITALGQVLFTITLGFLIAQFLGFPLITALYIAIALSFSSTIIIMKLLSDKEDLDKQYGKISVGFLLIQDIVAILILIVVSSLSNSGDIAGQITRTLLYGSILTIALAVVSIYFLPYLSKIFAKSQELLFLFSIGWGFALASVFTTIGFSMEVGALIAGVTLAMSPYSYEISSKLKPLRDFFMIAFFIVLGAQITLSGINEFIVPAIILSMFVLIGNPLIVIILMGILRYNSRVGFMAGLTVAQISEFSLILIALGVKVGHIPQEILSLVTLIALITITGSTYMIMYSHSIYPHISRYLHIFQRKNLKKDVYKELKYDYVLVGYNRIGFSVLKTLSKTKGKKLVIDFNPKIIKDLESKGIDAVYGDADDAEFIDSLPLHKAKMIVSTIPCLESNLLLLEKLKKKNRNLVMLATARQIDEAFKLYDAGADYVILPHFLGGDYTAQLLKKVGTKKRGYKAQKEKQIKELKERLKEGQDHPKNLRGEDRK